MIIPKKFTETRRPGQALVEFALIIPLFMVLLCGVIDMGYIFHEYLQLQGATREGGRVACVGASANEVSTRVANVLGSAWSDRTVTTLLEEIDQGGYDEVRVTVTSHIYAISPLAGFVPGLADGIAAQAHAIFRKE